VDLAAEGCTIRIYFNGNSSPGTTIALTGTVADGGVYVIADDDADVAILAHADQVSTSNCFNGDDAVALVKDVTFVDVIGQIGFDPGTAWGSGDVSTMDHTLRRRLGVCEADHNHRDERPKQYHSRRRHRVACASHRRDRGATTANVGGAPGGCA
jgi:predicted extracellular nuclease